MLFFILSDILNIGVHYNVQGGVNMGPRIYLYKGFVMFDPGDNLSLYNKLRESTFLTLHPRGRQFYCMMNNSAILFIKAYAGNTVPDGYEEVPDYISNSIDYSTSEKIIGTFNGKKLYRKCWFYTGFPTFSNNHYSFNHNISNIDRVKDIYGSIWDTVNQQYFPLQYVTTANANVIQLIEEIEGKLHMNIPKQQATHMDCLYLI